MVARSWFPGYVFCRFDVVRDPWQHALRAPGAIEILGDPPSPLDERVFLDMVARCPRQLMTQDARTVVPSGSEVEVRDGPFKGRTGIVASSRDSIVMVELFAFNRPTRVELQTKQVIIIR